MTTPTDDRDRRELRRKFRILRYFEYAHLPPVLQEISRPFCELAWSIAARTDVVDVAELVVALRKLRQAKDCAVCSVLPDRHGDFAAVPG